MKIPTVELKRSYSSVQKRKRVSFNSVENKENSTPQPHSVKKREDRRVRVLQSIEPKHEPASQPTSPRVTIPSIADAPRNDLIVPTNMEHIISIEGDNFIPLKLLGKGGSSTVYRVASCRDGSLYALKRIDIPDNEDADDVFNSYSNEISLLKALKGTSPYIIELVNAHACRQQKQVTLLLEAGDTDLAKLLSQRLKRLTNDQKDGFLDPLFARMIWKEMLLAVDHIHHHRIVHGKVDPVALLPKSLVNLSLDLGDLKPANFVFVKGHLKLIDFGIAKCISADTTNIYRDSQIGTVSSRRTSPFCSRQ